MSIMKERAVLAYTFQIELCWKSGVWDRRWSLTPSDTKETTPATIAYAV